jgi:phospholipid transport system substrate-binding protein
MDRRTMISGLAAFATALVTATAHAEPVAPDAFIRQLSTDVVEAVKGDKSIKSGDTARIRSLVDTKVMPHVNFERMTGMAVGPQWRGATPEQKKRMLEEFKTLLINTYSGAVKEVKDQSIVVKPLRNANGGDEVVVRSEVRGNGEPVQLDYRLEKAGDAWKIYDVNVAGFWVVEAYKGQFAKDLSNGGLDALINRLAEKNKNPSSAAPPTKS